MKFIRTLNQVQYSENTIYGNRACDLAHLAAERTPVPETFVLTCEAWETFIKTLKYKIDFILQQVNTEKKDTLVSTYNSIRRLIVNEQVPDSILFELKEAYESLGTGIELDEMTKEDTSPFVSMVASPDYVAEAESFEGIIQNIRTIEEIIIALKEIYAMQFTPEAISYRKKIGVKGFRCALIIQSMPESKASATAYSTDPEQQEMVFVHAYKGFTDIRDLVAKDFFHVKKEYLNLAASQIVEQTKIIIRDEEGKLFPDEFASRGQSMNDKEVMEVARIAKKSEKILGNPTKLFIAQEGDDFRVLWANRYDVPDRKTPESMGSSIGSMTVSAASAQGAQEMHEEALTQAKFDTSVDEGDEDVEAEVTEPDTLEKEFEGSAEDETFDEPEDLEDEPEKDEDFEESSQEDYSEEFVESPEDVSEPEDLEDEPEKEDPDESDYDEGYTGYSEDEAQDPEFVEESSEDDEFIELDSEDGKDDEEEGSDDETEERTDDEPQDTEDDEYIEYDETEESTDDEPQDTEDDEYIEYDETEESTEDEPQDTEDDEYAEYEDENSEEFLDETPVEEPQSEPEELDSSEEDKDIINKSVRVIYAELAKRYEETGEQAPDTITELIQKGVQKNAFNIEGLNEVLEIKRKVRTGDPITEEEKNHILGIVNQLV